MLRQHRSSDEGFTLIELIVTVAILSIVVVTLTGVVFGYLRTSAETSTRLNETTDEQFASAYWQQDVSSLGLRGVPSGGSVPVSPSVYLGGGAPFCAAPSGTSAIVTFVWNDYLTAATNDATHAWSDATQNAATYYTKTTTNANNTTQTQLRRKRCGSVSGDITVARFLTSDPTVTCLDKSGASTSCTGTSPFPVTVTMKMTVRDRGQAVHGATGTGYSNLTLTAERRQA